VSDLKDVIDLNASNSPEGSPGGSNGNTAEKVRLIYLNLNLSMSESSPTIWATTPINAFYIYVIWKYSRTIYIYFILDAKYCWSDSFE